jgi:hypothetical protein|tara:strand:- start:595 stop:1305 length:711 start_codon:yes stop_codon:yes gene_type:complete
LVIACGALARELLAITELNGLTNMTVECLPASLHNRPKEIPELVRARIRRARGQVGHTVPDTVCATSSGTAGLSDNALADIALLDDGTQQASGQFDEILIGYADCGTGGLLEKVCAEEGVEMLAGAHCYQFFATHDRFEELQDHALGSFYLTDFLARNWERLIWEGMGIAKHPELRDMYFGNYTRCVYLEQSSDPKALAAAHECADRLGLELHIEPTGYGELETAVVEFTQKVTLT